MQANRIIPEIVAQFENKQDGLKSTVAKYYKGGFSVVLWDTDANKALSFVTIYPEFNAAIAKAKSLIA